MKERRLISFKLAFEALKHRVTWIVAEIACQLWNKRPDGNKGPLLYHVFSGTAIQLHSKSRNNIVVVCITTKSVFAQPALLLQTSKIWGLSIIFQHHPLLPHLFFRFLNWPKSANFMVLSVVFLLEQVYSTKVGPGGVRMVGIWWENWKGEKSASSSWKANWLQGCTLLFKAIVDTIY